MNDEEKIVVKEPADEGFMCQVQCKGCLAEHLWSQLALNNIGFVCNHNLCGCRDYRLMGVETRKEPSKTPVGLRSTAPESDMFDLTALDKEDLIYLVQVLAKKAAKQ